MAWLVRNWHLKLAAVALATILYTGFVYSDSFIDDDFPGIPVRAINLPDGAYPLTQQLEPVDVTYRLSSDVAGAVEVDDFVATVDLAEYDMDAAPEVQALPIRVRALPDGVEVLGISPTTLPVALDRIGQKEVPVVVDRGEVPDGLSITPPRVQPREVTASGPQSQVSQVVRAVAQVQIFESGIDIANQQVNLLPVDVNGREVQSVELDPATVTIDIEVSTVETSKTVPVRPAVDGAPADGFEIISVTADPPVVTLFGTPDVLSPVTEVVTEQISVQGAAESQQVSAQLELPSGTRPADETTEVVLTIEIVPSVATRTLLVGVDCQGEATGVACLPQQGQLALTLSGSAVTLAGLDAADLTPVLDVSGLGPGQHDVTPTVALPEGVELVSLSPGTVTVTLQPPATPSPTPT